MYEPLEENNEMMRLKIPFIFKMVVYQTKSNLLSWIRLGCMRDHLGTRPRLILIILFIFIFFFKSPKKNPNSFCFSPKSPISPQSIPKLAFVLYQCSKTDPLKCSERRIIFYLRFCQRHKQNLFIFGALNMSP